MREISQGRKIEFQIFLLLRLPLQLWTDCVAIYRRVQVILRVNMAALPIYLLPALPCRFTLTASCEAISADPPKSAARFAT